MKRIERFNEGISKYSFCEDITSTSESTDVENLEKDIKKLTDLINLLPLPSEIAGIEITNEIKLQPQNPSGIEIDCGVWNSSIILILALGRHFPELLKRVQIKKGLLTKDERFTRQVDKYKKRIQDDPEFLKRELTIIRNGLQCRLNYLNEEIDNEEK